MIIDASVAAAVCLGEADAEFFITILETARNPRMSAATFVASAVVIDSRQPGAFDAFATALELEVLPVEREQAELARDAYRRYGRGSGHPARLNFGDCFSYAVARHLDAPLLFKGEDFALTDVQSATW